MINKIGFDTDKYLTKEVAGLIKRMYLFERLYLEFGGKLFSDHHAARVLPGYRPTTKIELIKKLGELDLYYCVSEEDIVKRKIRGDSGLSYDLQTVKDIEDITNFGIKVSGVIITRSYKQDATVKFKNKLENFGFKVFLLNSIDGYPTEMEKIIAGFEKQPYIKPKNKLVIVTGTGGGAGKMGFCLSQIYHERKRGVKSGFAKCETFPIWNLALKHPVNLAYEASTADLKDVNMVDPYHKKERGVSAINYNRDIENFAILKKLLVSITGEKTPFGYKSPTDMGLNMAKEGIIDDKACRRAAKDEIIRRVFRYQRERLEGKENWSTVERAQGILKKANLKEVDRKVVVFARKAAQDGKKQKKGFQNVYCGAAIELRDGRVITGKNSNILHAESAVILNTLKVLADIPDNIDLIDPGVLKEISEMKEFLKDSNNPSMSVDEVLIALASNAVYDRSAKKAVEVIGKLKDCEMHVTVLPSEGDEVGIRLLKINLTSDAKTASSRFI